MRKLMILFILLITTTLSAQESLSYGETVNGVITNQMPEVFYTFQGSRGDTIAIEMQAVESELDSFLRLLLPDGTEYASDDDGAGNLNALLAPIFLPEDGIYTIVATRCCGDFGNSEGAYQLTLKQIDVPVITLDDTVTLELAAEETAAYLLFNNTNVEQMAASVMSTRTSGVDQVQLEVRGPVGEMFYGYSPMPDASQSVISPLILQPNGAYLITVRRVWYFDTETEAQPLTVDVTIHGLNVTPFTFGQTLNGQLDDANDNLIYSFEAQDLLRIEAITNNQETGFEVRLYDPFGTLVDSRMVTGGISNNPLVVDPLPVQQAGTYYLVIQRVNLNSSDVTGQVVDYTVYVGASETLFLTSGVPVTDMIDNV
ncbi:MAG: hypothetical protein CUN56_13330, partial [Phototrophicales bacterium]